MMEAGAKCSRNFDRFGLFSVHPKSEYASPAPAAGIRFRDLRASIRAVQKVPGSSTHRGVSHNLPYTQYE